MKKKRPSLEIETKWQASKISRDRFIACIQQLQKDSSLHRGCTYKKVKGPDVYFRNALGYVARVRISGDKKEITVKARLSSTDITKRVEYNIPLSPRASISDVFNALECLGFQECLSIKKNCDIFYFTQKHGINLHVVYYVVKTKKLQDQAFIEIEPEHGTEKQRMKVLKRWKTLIEKHLGISSKDQINLSLFEIYTDKRIKRY